MFSRLRSVRALSRCVASLSKAVALSAAPRTIPVGDRILFRELVTMLAMSLEFPRRQRFSPKLWMIGLTYKSQMIRVDTKPVAACMVNMHAVRHFTNTYPVRIAVRRAPLFRLPVSTKNTVTTARLSGLPFPAFVGAGNGNLCPKTVFGSNNWFRLGNWLWRLGRAQCAFLLSLNALELKRAFPATGRPFSLLPIELRNWLFHVAACTGLVCSISVGMANLLRRFRPLDTQYLVEARLASGTVTTPLHMRKLVNVLDGSASGTRECFHVESIPRHKRGNVFAALL